MQNWQALKRKHWFVSVNQRVTSRAIEIGKGAGTNVTSDSTLLFERLVDAIGFRDRLRVAVAVALAFAGLL